MGLDEGSDSWADLLLLYLFPAFSAAGLPVMLNAVVLIYSRRQP